MAQENIKNSVLLECLNNINLTVEEQLECLKDFDTSFFDSNTNSSDSATTTVTSASTSTSISRTDTDANVNEMLPTFEIAFRNSNSNVNALECSKQFMTSDVSPPTSYENDKFVYQTQPVPRFCYEFPTNFGKTATYLKTSHNTAPCIYFETSEAIVNEFYLHIDLYEKKNNEIQFSPHSIARNSAELTAVPIFEKLQYLKTLENRRSFQFELEKFYINQANEKIRQKNFAKKIEEFNKTIINGRFEEKPYVPSNNDFGVMLGCQVFALDGSHYRAITHRIYTDVMYPENLLSLSIRQIRFKQHGGEKISIEIKKGPSLDNLRVLIGCKKHEGKHEAWNQICNVTQEMDKQINFITPKCEARIIDPNIEEINCCLRLITANNVICSKPLKVIYDEFPKNRRENPKKRSIAMFESNTEEDPSTRKLQKFQTDSCDAKSFDNATATKKPTSLLDRAIELLRRLVQECPKDMGEKFMELNDAYASQNEDENSIVHDAIAEDKYLIVYKIFGKNNFFELLPDLRNKYGETPLHYACKLGKHHFVLSLSGSFHSLYLQNSKKETPLHVAVSAAPACLAAFQSLMLDEYYATAEYKAAFYWLLQVYDENGLTFLHLTVIKRNLEFLEAILLYCQKHNIDACQFATLKTGDTILHLAQEQKVFDLILKYQPNAGTYTNYENKTALKYLGFNNLVEDFEKISL